ncbi:protein NUCLEAR FUSION DEFECTIVE 6, chloroplastic/mitochondrial-like isoform X3 [Selaginella moellendorffii]|uniref:protein NUCLEAR FUSION DEFECTIVE 6, chloroplastic/mitochondrial-like isoform X3 n=1 Tax=Selaginella moellendorffii TaxID=88036 RepID=UPI000D1C8D2D|nr:protein NUCLEAR FUSION DEFECTIVE 6, chloroplastic/mitochondrial-like isoform X3 [Selaginella moellendorffii]XP_024541414.1 protein NUCLEAR FUSION DEFECTIVE 6, chloroplastic/mitochondrial-like isoform X3 [Selaginella moellendorffii]|eukprot:XP_024537670.1 protein NUCLEAR FUSION DEFECTIVE 6, chloroplastic/mitochondrial-like isoform X3 [Selaginella moellendorffii]
MAARSAGRFARAAFANAASAARSARPQAPPLFRARAPQRNPLGGVRSSGLLRREIVSMLPMHTATAKAWLVSRISEVPGDAGVFTTLPGLLRAGDSFPARHTKNTLKFLKFLLIRREISLRPNCSSKR